MGQFTEVGLNGFTGAGRSVRRQLTGLLLLMAATGMSPSQAATITVDGDDGVIAVDGLCSINEAIANANDGGQTHAECAAGSAGADTIVVTDFVTLEATVTIADGRNGTLSITSPITVDGQGFQIARSVGLPCNLDSTDNAGEFRIFHVPSGGNLMLQDVELKNGCADQPGEDLGSTGAGVLVNGGQLTITRSLISGNQARIYGGGVLNFNGGTVSAITDTTFLGNSAIIGGALGNGSNIGTLSGNTFANNSVSATGGAITVNSNGSIQTLINNTFANNRADAEGAGVHMDGGTFIGALSNNTFSGNVSPVPSVLVMDEVTTFSNNILVGNSAGGACAVTGAFNATSAANRAQDNTCPGNLGAVTNIELSRSDNGCVTPGPLGCTFTFALLAGSNAIDGAVSGTATDQRGFAAFNGRDIGAWESADQDSDGLGETDEILGNTDPYDPDTDDDGVRDGLDPNPVAMDDNSCNPVSDEAPSVFPAGLTIDTLVICADPDGVVTGEGAGTAEVMVVHPGELIIISPEVIAFPPGFITGPGGVIKAYTEDIPDSGA